MTIVAVDSISGFFEGVVDEAMHKQGVSAPDAVATYLVGVLSTFAEPGAAHDEAFSRPMTFLLDEARHVPDRAERFERLRKLGDGVLYSCGFFRDHMDARGIDAKYVRGIGASAYAEAGQVIHGGPLRDASGTIDIFKELAQRFDSLVKVVAYVADATIAAHAPGPKGVIAAYERWLRTGSECLAEVLTAQGLIPTRGGSGVQ